MPRVGASSPNRMLLSIVNSHPNTEAGPGETFGLSFARKPLYDLVHHRNRAVSARVVVCTMNVFAAKTSPGRRDCSVLGGIPLKIDVFHAYSLGSFCLRTQS